MIDGSKVWAVALVAASVLAGRPVMADDCPVFLLKNAAEGLTIEKVILPAGETQVWPASEATGVIEIVLPVSAGVSGSVAGLGGGQLHVVRCTGSEVQHQDQVDGESRFNPPARALEDLRAHDVRVSVTGPAGAKAAFLITGYDRVVTDLGPVQNLFAGQPIPLGETDYILTTDTYAHAAERTARGDIEVELANHPFALGRVPGGGEGWFLVDVGAAETLVARSFLSPATSIEESKMVEYSGTGRRLLKYSPGGATGQVGGILGHAEIPTLHFGNLQFEQARVAVIDELPDLFDRPIVGILGIDLLRRADLLILEFPPEGRGSGRLRLAGSEAQQQGDRQVIEVGFSILQKHLVVPVSLNGFAAHLILDTGAPEPFLNVRAARHGKVAAISGTEQEVGGLDGGKTGSSQGIIDQLGVGGRAYEQVPCRIADLPVLASLSGDDQRIGLMGNSFLGRFERVEIDFIDGRVRFIQ